MAVIEYRVKWGGGAITGPGTSVFHGRVTTLGSEGAAAEDLAGRVQALFTALASKFPSGITWSFPGEALALDVTTKALEDVLTFTAPAQVVSTATSSGYSRAAGARIDWLTPSIVSGRRLTGRTYLVPIAGPHMAADGTLESTSITSILAAANAYKDPAVFTDVQPAVWSRTHGILADITAARVPDMSTVLRSRRD